MDSNFIRLARRVKDLETVLANYLPLSGGKMTGPLKLSADGLLANNDSGIYLDQYGNVIAKSTVSSGGYWHVDDVNSNVRLKIPIGSDGGDILLDGKTAWHTGNFDYEGGEWTPAIGGSTLDGDVSYGTRVGRYIKIGNLVTVWCNVVLSAITTQPSGQMYIRGLPATPNLDSISSEIYTDMTYPGDNVIARFAAGSSFIRFYTISSNSKSNYDASGIGGTDTISFMGTYRVT